MNDSSEFISGINNARRELAKLKKAKDVPQLFFNRVDSLLEKFANDAGLVFVACFSAKENNLAMWRNYSQADF
ncbi:MAG TPA: hypothetical protein VFW00_14500 [Rhodocyclaceae bacterium]|nr:hypothetical protein [Rhodocyclaceae bacterium]